MVCNGLKFLRMPVPAAAERQLERKSSLFSFSSEAFRLYGSAVYRFSSPQQINTFWEEAVKNHRAITFTSIWCWCCSKHRGEKASFWRRGTSWLVGPLQQFFHIVTISCCTLPAVSTYSWLAWGLKFFFKIEDLPALAGAINQLCLVITRNATMNCDDSVWCQIFSFYCSSKLIEVCTNLIQQPAKK